MEMIMAVSKHKNLVPLYLAKILWEETDENHGLTLKELTKRLQDEGLDIEEQTVIKSIHILEGKKEKNDDFQIQEDLRMDIKSGKDDKMDNYKYRLNSRLFEPSELQVLVKAAHASNFISEKQFRSLLKKLQKLAGRNQAEDLGYAVRFPRPVKTSDENFYEFDNSLTAINQAFQKGRQLRFKYFWWSIDKEKKYYKNGNEYTSDSEEAQWKVVSPWYIYYDNGNLYLIAYRSGCAGNGNPEPTHYRVDKMRDAEILQDPVAPEIPKSPEAFGNYANGLFGMYSGEARDVTLGGFGDKMANVIIDQFGLDVDLQRKSEDSFSFRAKVHVAVSPQFYSWLSGMEGKIWIIEPEDVREGMVRFLGRNIDEYHPFRLVTLEADAEMEETVRSLFYNKHFKAEPLSSSKVRITTYVHLGPAFFHWLAGQNGKVRITGPEDVLNEIQSYAGRILNACSTGEQKPISSER